MDEKLRSWIDCFKGLDWFGIGREPIRWPAWALVNHSLYMSNKPEEQELEIWE